MEVLRGRAHDVESGAAVHVNINVAGGENGIGKIFGEIHQIGAGGNFFLVARRNRRDHSVVDEDERVLDFVDRSKETMGAEDNHISLAISVTRAANAAAKR